MDDHKMPEWSGPTAPGPESCVPITCPVAELPSDDFVWSTDRDKKSRCAEKGRDLAWNETCSIECREQFVEDKFTTTQCKTNHETPAWNKGVTPTCVPITCPVAKLPSNPGLVWGDGRCEGGDLNYKDACTASCDPSQGFVLPQGVYNTGFVTERCLDNGVSPAWTIQPTCELITCPVVSLPEHVEWTGENAESCTSGLDWKGFCTAKCEKGFVGKNQDGTVSSDKIWTTDACRTNHKTPAWTDDVQPTCVPITCPAPDLIAGLKWNNPEKCGAGKMDSADSGGERADFKIR